MGCILEGVAWWSPIHKYTIEYVVHKKLALLYLLPTSKPEVLLCNALMNYNEWTKKEEFTALET